MPGSATQSASSGDDVGGGLISWTTPENIVSPNDQYAIASAMNFGVTSNILVARFDFSALPNDASILGIEVSYERKKADVGGVDETLVQLWNGTGSGDGIGDDKASDAALPASDTVASFGGSADKWNAPLTMPMVKSAAFGVGFQGTHDGGGSPADFHIDHVSMTVHYQRSELAGQGRTRFGRQLRRNTAGFS